MKDLFSNTSENCSLMYKKMRDEAETDSLANEGRKHCEEFWEIYEPSADTQFLSDFSDPNVEKLHARWFEMYLAVALIKKGLPVCRKRRNKGPDILLEMEDHRIWIEATCATRGDNTSPDYVPEPPIGQCNKLDIEKYVLRITSSLYDKQKKFKEYLDKGYVKKEDKLVIAINFNLLGEVLADNYNLFLRALYRVGDPVIQINTTTNEATRDYITANKIPKDSGCDVKLGYFSNGSMPCISAALSFAENLLPYSSRKGESCVTYPNLTSENKWKEGSIPMGIEWLSEEIEDGWSLTKKEY